jgi:hypothetical protein
MELKTAFKLLVPTKCGGSTSDTKVNISSTGIRRLSMSMKERILKDKILSYGESIMVSTKNGRLFILRTSKHIRLRDTMSYGDSISTDHS